MLKTLASACGNRGSQLTSSKALFVSLSVSYLSKLQLLCLLLTSISMLIVSFCFYLNAPSGLVHGLPDGSDRKRLPSMWESWVLSLGWEDPLEKEMALHYSSILA